MKNHELLIEKVGGIEKAREIVVGAPAWPVIGFCITGHNYIFRQCEHVPCSYSPIDNAWSEEYAISLVLIDDLRTAIAEHDAAKQSMDSKQIDDVADFGYHVSPLTVVTELHVNEALRLNELG